MAEPGILLVHFRSGESERVATHPLRTGRLGQQVLDGILLEDAHAVVAHAEIHQHLVELELIVGGGPESSTRGGEHVGVVVGTLLHIVLEPVLRRGVLHTVIHFDLGFELFVGRPEPGGGHAERKQNPLLEEILPALSGDHFNDSGADVDAGVGVLHFGAGFKQQRGGRRNRRGLAEGRAAGPAAALDVPLLGGDLEWESAGVVHDHADGEGRLRLDEGLHTVFVGFLDPERLEFRQVFRDRVIQIDLALFDQHGDGDTAETLGLGALHEHVIHGDGAFGRDVGISDAGGLLNAVFVEDVDGARELTFLDVGHQRVLGEGGVRLRRTVFHRLASGDERQSGETHQSFCELVHFASLVVTPAVGFLPLCGRRLAIRRDRLKL